MITRFPPPVPRNRTGKPYRETVPGSRTGEPYRGTVSTGDPYWGTVRAAGGYISHEFADTWVCLEINGHMEPR